MKDLPKSTQLFERAQQLLPGGVNSPVRAFRAVGGTPPFMTHGEGPYLFDVDGNRYVDYVLSYGPLVLGHADPDVVAAITEATQSGTSFGTPHEQEIELAAMIQSQMPSLQMMRFVNSGTEATMSALRLARAFTGRSKIVKFEGCYHGHADFLLVKAGSGVATLGLPDSPGVTGANSADTLTASYNDFGALEQIFEQVGKEIAAVIIEPVAGNMGLVLPHANYLANLKSLCERYGTLLIFDEVMTGFRVAPGGAQAHFGVEPDLTTLGKVIGGGLPVGAYGGRRDIMEMIAPVGPVYQAGTLSGNPLSMAAGIATLKKLLEAGRWEQMIQAAERLDAGIQQAAATHGVRVACQRIGSMSGMYFMDETPDNWSEVSEASRDQFVTYFHAMLENGVFLAPSPFEAAFVSTTHDVQAIDATLEAANKAFQKVAETHFAVNGCESTG